MVQIEHSRPDTLTKKPIKGVVKPSQNYPTIHGQKWLKLWSNLDATRGTRSIIGISTVFHALHPNLTTL